MTDRIPFVDLDEEAERLRRNLTAPSFTYRHRDVWKVADEETGEVYVYLDDPTLPEIIVYTVSTVSRPDPT